MKTHVALYIQCPPKVPGDAASRSVTPCRDLVPLCMTRLTRLLLSLGNSLGNCKHVGAKICHHTHTQKNEVKLKELNQKYDMNNIITKLYLCFVEEAIPHNASSELPICEKVDSLNFQAKSARPFRPNLRFVKLTTVGTRKNAICHPKWDIFQPSIFRCDHVVLVSGNLYHLKQ